MFSAIVRPSTTSSSWYIVAMPSSIADSGVGISTWLALPGDLAVIRAVHAGERLDERRLARAVLAEDAVHLAGNDLQVDAAKGVNTGERLRHAADVE